MKNEYGNASKLALYGVEILNEGMGMSVDDITTEKACTFVARKLEHMKEQ
jgi:molybdopterin-biosynthesis enzyme MoeA-like protein